MNIDKKYITEYYERILKDVCFNKLVFYYFTVYPKNKEIIEFLKTNKFEYFTVKTNKAGKMICVNVNTRIGVIHDIDMVINEIIKICYIFKYQNNKSLEEDINEFYEEMKFEFEKINNKILNFTEVSGSDMI